MLEGTFSMSSPMPFSSSSLLAISSTTTFLMSLSKRDFGAPCLAPFFSLPPRVLPSFASSDLIFSIRGSTHPTRRSSWRFFVASCVVLGG